MPLVISPEGVTQMRPDCDHMIPCETEEQHAEKLAYTASLKTRQFQGPGEYAMEIRKRDRDFAVDNAAYRRLRAEGLQPRGVNKSAMAEKLADNKAEIELGRSLFSDEKDAYRKTYGNAAGI